MSDGASTDRQRNTIESMFEYNTLSVSEMRKKLKNIKSKYSNLSPYTGQEYLDKRGKIGGGILC